MTTNTQPCSQHDLSYHNTLSNSDYNKKVFNTATVILSSGNQHIFAPTQRRQR